MGTLAVERHADVFDGALAGCGPIGDLGAQLNYIGDFRVVFDYLFPGVIPGTAVDVPESLRSRWDEIYVPAIVIALAANFDAALELIRITGAPVAGNDLRSVAETTVGILWYDVFGIADAQARLGGQPFDNSTRVYTGSSNDAALNAGVATVHGRSRDLGCTAAVPDLRQSHRSLSSPCIRPAIPIVPFAQARLYGDKVSRAGKIAQLDHTTDRPVRSLHLPSRRGARSASRLSWKE